MVTLSDIAKKTKLSRMTISQILRGVANVRPETRERVLETARKLGYRPNVAARAMATGRFGSVALVMRHEILDFFPFDMFRGICDTLSESNMHMLLARIPKEEFVGIEFAPKILREFASDGLLVHESVDIDSSVVKMIGKLNIPAVWINSKTEFDCVYPDDFEASYRATKELIGAGHRNILFLEFSIDWKVPDTHYSKTDRRNGYEKAMAESRIKPVLYQHAYKVIEDGSRRRPWGGPDDDRISRVLALLKDHKRPTAVITPNPESAGPVLHAAGLLGIEVPRELSIVTINHEPSIESGFSISTMLIPTLECGVESVKMIMRKIEKPAIVMPAQSVKFGAMQGNTFAPAPKGGAFRKAGARPAKK